MKRIVICGDGTWNERDRLDEKTGTRRPTNVTKTARAIRPHDDQGVSQVTYYHAGVGTGGPLDQLTGGAFGDGLEINVQEMYRFIAYNYERGDELFLFGFSRGAFTVRSLAGFIHFAGLVTKDEDYYVPDLYKCYATGQGPGTPGWNHLFVDLGRRGKPRLVDRRSTSPVIRFMGVWDTVGSLGPPGILGKIATKLQPSRHTYHAVGLNPLMRHVAHALAVDERRQPFRPEVFSRGNWQGTLKQAWFAGVHTDIGGGYDYDDHANHALNWILTQAEDNGLALDRVYLEPFSHSRPDVALHDSMSTAYRLLGPIERPIGQFADGEESIHPSTIARMKAVESYQPANVLHYLKKAGLA